MISLWLSLIVFSVVLSVAKADGISLQTAYIQVVIYQNSGSDYTTYSYDLKGSFVKSGATTSAEGDILQIHPLGLCNTSGDDNLYEYGWVGVVKLTVPEMNSPPCMGVFDKAKRAIQRGATALIFDVRDDPGASEELNSVEATVDRPVVIIEGEDAEKLMNIVKRQKVARARINYQVIAAADVENKRGSNEYFDMVIFMTFFVLVSIICFFLLLKIKWKQKQKETSLTRMALHAVSRMEARKYISSKQTSSEINDDDDDDDDDNDDELDEESFDENDDTSSCCSRKHQLICVICLEKFKDGQEIRVVPCQHEFHRDCVDPWLLTNHTCPLCMLNIVETEHNRKKPRRSRNIIPYIINQLCSSARNRLRQQVLQDSQTTSGMSQSVSLRQDDGIESSSNRNISISSLSSQLGSTDHLEALRKNETLAHSLEALNTDSFIKMEDSLCYSYSSKSSIAKYSISEDDISVYNPCETCGNRTQGDIRWNFRKQSIRSNDCSSQRTCGYLNPTERQCLCNLMWKSETILNEQVHREFPDNYCSPLQGEASDNQIVRESIHSSCSSLETVQNSSVLGDCMQTDLSVCGSQSVGCITCQSENCGSISSVSRSETDLKDYTRSIVVIADVPGDAAETSPEDVV